MTNGSERAVCALKDIWSEALGVASVGPDDDFFKLGGDSMTGTVITTQVEAVLDVKMELVDVFEWCRFEEYADLVLKRISGTREG